MKLSPVILFVKYIIHISSDNFNSSVKSWVYFRYLVKRGILVLSILTTPTAMIVENVPNIAVYIVPIFPLKLQEAHFLETKYTTVSCRGFPVRYVPPREPVVPCPDDVICTRSVLSNSNICHKDEGSPLYVVNMCSDSQLSAFGGPGTVQLS